MNGRPVPVTNAEQSQKTRRALLDTARATFTVQGYAAASTGEIVCRAGVTRGALYYHFRDKAALFEAVFDEVRGEHIQALRTAMAAAEGDDWQRLMTWVGLTLERILDPSVPRIVYIDGPAVLNWSSEQRRAPAIAFVAGTPAGSAPHERGGGCASAGSPLTFMRELPGESLVLFSKTSMAVSAYASGSADLRDSRELRQAGGRSFPLRGRAIRFRLAAFYLGSRLAGETGCRRRSAS